MRKSCIVLGVAISLGACGNVESASPDAAPPEVDAAPVELCTPSTPGSAPADEDGDGLVDEGCDWHFGAPHWMAPWFGLPRKTPEIDPVWVSPDGRRLYVVVHEADYAVQSRAHVMSRKDAATPFDKPVEVTGADLGKYTVLGMTLSHDETEAFLVASPVGQPLQWDVYRATRADAGGRFGALQRLANLSTDKAEERPFLRDDGKELIVSSGRRLMRAVRASTAESFGDAAEIPGLPTGQLNAAAMTADGHTLFFYGQAPATQHYRIYRSERTDVSTAIFGDPVELSELEPTGSYNVFHPVLSESTRELFFGSSQPWSPTTNAIWRAQICRDGACPTQLVDCPTGFRSADGRHCYTELTAAQPYADAEKACRAQGGHLASVTSAAERDLVSGRFGANHWLGGFDARDGIAECSNKGSAPETKVTCVWGWETGEAWTYAPWAFTEMYKQEPNNGSAGSEDCLKQWGADVNGDWNDAVCTQANKAICETVLYPTW